MGRRATATLAAASVARTERPFVIIGGAHLSAGPDVSGGGRRFRREAGRASAREGSAAFNGAPGLVENPRAPVDRRRARRRETPGAKRRITLGVREDAESGHCPSWTPSRRGPTV